MKLMFLPYVHEGIVPTGSAAGRAHASIALALESPGRPSRSVSRPMPLAGPGDVLAIELRQVLRATPAAGSRDAEPEFFPAVEFDAPDLPWAYSPVVPDQRRVLPWIVLVVVEARPDVSILPGQQGQSPWILRLPNEVARRELPDLSDSWAWAHAQVTCEEPALVAATLARHPDRTLSRLLSPRRLLPFRAYHACVVPAFRSGRIAGLGGNPASDPSLVTGHEPSWSDADRPAELPVYYSWSFRTGDAGDFESLAQRLHAAPLDASIAPTPLHLSFRPEPPARRRARAAEADINPALVVDWEPPLRVPGKKPSRARRPQAAVSQIRSALRPGSATRRVLGPGYFGEPWTGERTAAPIDAWGPELNLTPMFRAAAGLGAEAVRVEQESLVEAASEQLDAFRTRQREGRRRQLAATFVNRVKLRLSAAPARESARVFAPTLTATQRAASNVGIYTVAGRTMSRKPWRAAAPPGIDVTGPVAPPATDATLRLPIPPELADIVAGELILPPLVVRAPVKAPPPPVAPSDPSAIPTGAFSPRFARPMSEPLADRHPELMLPGGGSIEPDGVMLVESDPVFVEAFLVGANQEINYELLWRGLPSDARATAFRRFWAHAGGSDDIDDIGTWEATSPLGAHVKTSAALILLVRSELVRRYPSVLVAAVPAQWNTDGSRSPVQRPGRLVLPGFRGRIGADVLYAGFSAPSIEHAIGNTSPSAESPGWFFLLSENPGDPRFGLDPDGGTAPPTRATLSWRHLSPPPDGPYAPIASFPAVADAGFAPAHATAASVATLVRQRPFRAFLHASLLIRAAG